MFDFAARLRLLSGRDRQLSRKDRFSDPAAETDRKNTIRLLLITRDDNWYLFVHNIATRCGWDLRLSRSVEQGVRVLDEFTEPLVIYDWIPVEGDWRIAVDLLAARSDHACVLLASPVVDQYLWAELIRHGGFEIIPRSADMDELIRIIRFARRSSDVTRGGRPFLR